MVDAEASDHCTHHWVSPKHLDRYVTEMTFRMNRRDMPKGDRVKRRKLEPPLYLDLPTDEALERFIQTKPEEVAPPRGRARKRPGPKPGPPKGEPST